MKFFALLILATASISMTFAQNEITSFDRKEGDDRDLFEKSFAPFYHGVASGDPLNDRVIIWTRVTPQTPTDYSISVDWKMAKDLNFDTIVQTGTFVTDTSRDYTVKIDVTGLTADSYYYYQFEAYGTESLIGRTKTTPSGIVDQIRLGVGSCSDYRKGYFNAYRMMAMRNDLDAVVHLGDYIYEGGGGPADRLHDPDAEIYRLVDYRQRLSQYHLDTDLMRCHQMHPFIIIWDDHDIVVDALRDTSLRHYPQHGNYSDRKHAAVQAFYEWLPVRQVDTTDYYRNWKQFDFGSLMQLYTIDVRIYDKDPWPVDQNDPTWNDPSLRNMGPYQLNWFLGGLQQTNSRWKIVANQLMVAQFNAVTNEPLIYENWDGYPQERQEFFSFLDTWSIDNVVFCTGDWHCSFACDLTPNPRDPFSYNSGSGFGSLATEFIVPSLTGDNFDEGNNYGLPDAAFAEWLITTANPHIKYSDLESHGYILLDIDMDRAQSEFWFQDIQNPADSTETLGEIWFTNHLENYVQQGSTVSSEKPINPDIPPFIVPQDTTSSSVSELSDDFLMLNYGPNPFTQYLTINYVLNKSADVSVQVTDLQGKVIKQIDTPQQSRGNYMLYVDANDLSAGNYLVSILLEGQPMTTFQAVKK